MRFIFALSLAALLLFDASAQFVSIRTTALLQASPTRSIPAALNLRDTTLFEMDVALTNAYPVGLQPDLSLDSTSTARIPASKPRLYMTGFRVEPSTQGEIDPVRTVTELFNIKQSVRSAIERSTVNFLVGGSAQFQLYRGIRAEPLPLNINESGPFRRR